MSEFNQLHSRLAELRSQRSKVFDDQEVWSEIQRVPT